MPTYRKLYRLSNNGSQHGQMISPNVLVPSILQLIIPVLRLSVNVALS